LRRIGGLGGQQWAGGRRDGGRGGAPLRDRDLACDPCLRERSYPSLLRGLLCHERLERLVDRCEQPAFTGEVAGDRPPLFAECRQCPRAQPPLPAEKLLTVPHLLMEELGLLRDRAVLRREDVGRLEPIDQVGDARRSHDDLGGGAVWRQVQVDETSFDAALGGVEVRARDAKTRLVHAEGAVDRSELDARAVPGLHGPLEARIDHGNLPVDGLRVLSLCREIRRRRGGRHRKERNEEGWEESSRVHEGGDGAHGRKQASRGPR
jgi:hypothetical protein